MTDMTLTAEGLPAAPTRHWYTRWPLMAAAGAVITAAVVLPLTLTGGGPGGAAGILQHDGYTVVRTLDASQVQASLAADKTNGPTASTFIAGDAAVGVKNTSEEAAIKLSDSGKITLTAMLPLLTSSATSNGFVMRIQGDYLVVTGTATAFGTANPFAGLGG